MKKCFIMFVCFVLSLIFAVLFGNLEEPPTDKIMSHDLTLENQITNKR